MSKKLDLSKQKFGRLMVVREAGRTKQKGLLWECLCSCGKKKTVSGNSLMSGQQSCGCLRKEKATKHGCSGRRDKKKERIYSVWEGMKSRCSDKKRPSYEHYGKRGIKICKEWLEFVPFYEWAMANGYKDDLTIERIDCNGNYEPSNCKFIPKKEQSKNTTNNIRITYKGTTLILAEWARRFNVKYSLLYRRLLRGWTIEKTFETPPNYSCHPKMMLT